MRAAFTSPLYSALLATALLTACGTTVVNPVTGEAERTVMDEQAEVAEGQKAHQAVIKEQGVYDNPKLQAYVNDVGQKLAAQSHRAHLSWTFTVLDSPEINAFALPGGYVYVTRGIMAYLDSEAELAGVMGHEIGHVTARHGAQRATRQRNAGFGVIAATVLGAVLEGAGVRGATDLVGQASQTVAAGYVASYSREQESQADELGAEYLARNHYDPQNMVDVIALLKNQERFAADTARAEGRPAPSGSNWLSSHPSNEQRLADIRNIALQYQGQRGVQYSDDGRARYLQAIEGMGFGDSREQGVVRGANFYHEPLGIALTAPAGWRVQNTASAIGVVNQAGDAGLVIKLVPQELGTSHEAILRKLLGNDQSRLDARATQLTLHGLSATRYDITARGNPGGNSIRVTLVTGPQNRVYQLRQSGRDAKALQGAQAGLQEAEASFRPLSAADRKAAQPWTVRTQPLPKGGFAELARQSALLQGEAPSQERAEAQLKLLNGAYGEEASARAAALKPGQVVKTIR